MIDNHLHKPFFHTKMETGTLSCSVINKPFQHSTSVRTNNSTRARLGWTFSYICCIFVHPNLDSVPLGTLSKPRRQRQRERRQTKGLMSRTIAVHVLCKSLYISLLFSAKQQREMTKFCVFWRTLATTENILNFLMELVAGIS